MRWQRLVAGAVGSGVVLAGARLGMRVLGPRESAHSSSSPCGTLVWRTETVTSKAVFDSKVTLVRSAAFLEQDGRTIAEGIDDMRCVFDDKLRSLAVVLVRENDRRTLQVIDGTTGTRLERTPMPFDVESFSISPQATRLVATSAAGEVAIANVVDGREPFVLSRDAHVVPRSLAWLDEGSVCWVTGKPLGTADMWCSKNVETPKWVISARWQTDGVTLPWVGVSTAGPRLCGDDLLPNDAACHGLSRRP